MSDVFVSQVSGPVAQNTIAAIVGDIQYTDPLIAYFYSLSIDTANAQELASIGLLCGLPWPTLPSGYVNDDGFELGAVADFPDVDHAHGLGTVSDTYGGLLGSVFDDVGSLIPIQLYRQVLKAFAILKYENITLHSIDAMCFAFGPSYIIQIPRVFFTFGAAADYPTVDSEIGFGSTTNTGGGPFASALGIDPPSDVSIIFPHDTPNSTIFVLQEIFNRVATEPQFIVSRGAS